jgi:hypothetical protein
MELARRMNVTPDAAMPSLLRLSPSPDKGIIHVVVEFPKGATSKIKYDVASSRTKRPSRARTRRGGR